MGCDIHMYVEYKRKENTNWQDFGGRINPGRNYSIFTNLASVRSNVTGNKPKGIPDDVAYSSRNDNLIFIDESGGDDTVTRERALRWVKSGSKIVDDTWVTHPDWHSHSWATIEELEDAVNKDTWGGAHEYRAVLAAMKCLESDGFDVRAVYWFDN
jgi:hypothetical protein